MKLSLTREEAEFLRVLVTSLSLRVTTREDKRRLTRLLPRINETAYIKQAYLKEIAYFMSLYMEQTKNEKAVAYRPLLEKLSAAVGVI